MSSFQQAAATILNDFYTDDGSPPISPALVMQYTLGEDDSQEDETMPKTAGEDKSSQNNEVTKITE